MTSDAHELTPEEIRYIEQHGGLQLPQGPIDAGELERRRRAETQEQTAYVESLTLTEAADRLGVTADDLAEMIKGRRVVVRQFGAELRLPGWQFVQSGLLPHLGEVLHALPPDAHPLTITGFFTNPDSDLDDLTVAEWLADGRDPKRVLWLADTLQRW